MARSRNIKPGFYKNEDLAECSIWARYIFPGLWMLADREGRLEDRPKRIKGELLPFDSQEAEPLLKELSARGFIIQYEVDGKAYIQITAFKKHQNPHHKEQSSVIPPPQSPGFTPDATTPKPRALPPCDSTNASDKPEIHQATSDFSSGVNPADSLLLIPDSLNPITTTSPAGGQLACPVEEIVSLYHESMPTNPRCKVLNPSRRGAIKARWLEASRLTCEPFGYSTRADGIHAWRTFFETCNESAFLTGQAPSQPGKPPFLADIDFLISPSGFTKCLENKYHRGAA